MPFRVRAGLFCKNFLTDAAEHRVSGPGNDPDNYCYAAAARLSGPLGITTKYEEKRLCVSGTWIDKKLVVWEFKHEFKRPEDQVIEGSHSTGIHVTPQEVSTGLQIPMGSGKPVSN